MPYDSFTSAYIDAALWSSTDDEGDPLEDNYSVDEIAPETLAQIVADCAKFQTDNADLITNDSYEGQSTYTVEALAGHDFWLTRNGHGAGFWDGDWSEPAGIKLDEASKAFGEFNLYVGDDGRIYS